MTEQSFEYGIKFHKIDKPTTDNAKRLGNGHWLELQEIEYIDPNVKATRKWEVCKRKSPTATGDKKSVDGKIYDQIFNKLQ